MPDQANITCIGRVTGIEIKENVYTGEEESVVYLKQLEEDTTVLAYFSPVVELSGIRELLTEQYKNHRHSFS